MSVIRPWNVLTLLAAMLAASLPVKAPAAPAPAAAWQTAPLANLLDLKATKAYGGGVELPGNAEDVTGIVEPGYRGRGWFATLPNNAVHLPVTFLVAFREPVEAGSVEFGGSPRMLSVLKPGAPYPPDPANAAQWQEIPVPANQSGGAGSPSRRNENPAQCC